MGDDAVRIAAEGFLRHAFHVLQSQHVLPTPRFDCHLKVGRDYFGPDLEGDARSEFEKAIEVAYPERFANPLMRPDPEFASSYTFSVLEAAIVNCAMADLPFAVPSAATSSAIEQLIAVLRDKEFEVVCCRVVGHLNTTDGRSASIGEIEVLPELEDDRFGLLDQVCQLIPGAHGVFNREFPFIFDRPHALVVARSAISGESPHDTAATLSGGIDRFLLGVRLVHSATVHCYYQISGSSRLISHYSPVLTFFPADMMSLLVRSASLDSSSAPGLAGVGALVDTADVSRSKMATTSLDAALQHFHNAPYRSSAYEQIIDLATALEATLLGGDKSVDEITLRLRSRAARLLATERDPPGRIFDDVGQLYGLRSSLVHGGNLKEKDLRHFITRLSTARTTDGFGVAVARAVDRLSDLVRRALLARLSLAAGSDPPWPFGGTTPVDRLLLDDDTAAAWRTRWHGQLADVGVAEAADRPREAADFLSRFRADA